MNLLYTDTEQVREAMQLTNEDLPDEQFAAGTLCRNLSLDLDEWLPTHATIVADGTAASPSAAELTRYNRLVAYCTYFYAHAIMSVAALALPQQISDGKNSIQRFSNTDVSALKDVLAGYLLRYRLLLTADVNGTTSTTLPVFTGVGSSYDPVIGT